MWRTAELRMRRNISLSLINNFEFFKICYGTLAFKIGHCEYGWWHFRVNYLLPSPLVGGEWVCVVLGGCSRSYCDLGVYKMYPSQLSAETLLDSRDREPVLLRNFVFENVRLLHWDRCISECSEQIAYSVFLRPISSTRKTRWTQKSGHK